MISVTGSFVNVTQGYILYVVTFPKPGKTFYLKAEHLKTLLKVALKKHKVLNLKEDGNWIETVLFCGARHKEYREESIRRRTSSGNTIDLVLFVHAVPVGEEEYFAHLLAARIKYFFDVSRKRKSNITGKAALNYVCGLPRGSTGGIEKFCLNKGGRDAYKAAKIMTMEIDAHFKDGYSLQYDVPLNRFMVDWDIKQFLTDYVGIPSWDDLSEDDKKNVSSTIPRSLFLIGMRLSRNPFK